MRPLVTLAAAALALACGSTAGPAAAPSQTASPTAPRASDAPSAASDATPSPAPAPLPPPTDTLLRLHNLERAQAIAQRDDKEILLVFAGSDWCRPCMAFERGVLKDARFQQGAGQRYVVVYLDFPAKRRNALPDDQKAYNESQAKRFNPEGSFPRIFLLDARGAPLGEMKYVGQTADAFAAQLAEVARS